MTATKSAHKMKKKVRYSKYSIISTAGVLSALCIAAAYAFLDGESVVGFLILAIMLAINIPAAFNSPLYIEITSHDLELVMLARRKVISLNDIASARTCKPAFGTIRICGSGGFYGYWGRFREKNIGKYFAYYGCASDCFLLTLTDGRKYMVSCTDSSEIIQYLNSKISGSSDT